MINKRITGILVLLLLIGAFSARSQSGTYTLKGNLYIKGGDKFPYQLVFNITGNNIVGYSVTKWPNGVEPRVKIRGEIDKKLHTLAYTETAVITALPLAGNLCFVDTKMRYELRGGRYFIFGTFKGKDKNGRVCGEGAVEFEEPYVPGSLFYPDSGTAKKSVHSQQPSQPTKQKTITTPGTQDTIPTDEVVNGYHKITEGVPQRLTWNSDYCSIKVWDGGVIDGDVISILLNGKEVLTNYTLAKTKKQLFLALSEKINTITIVAGAEGTASPNTAQMILNDGPIEHKIMTFNKEGKTASIIITKSGKR